jgi:hypothetical protein
MKLLIKASKTIYEKNVLKTSQTAEFAKHMRKTRKLEVYFYLNLKFIK